MAQELTQDNLQEIVNGNRNVDVQRNRPDLDKKCLGSTWGRVSHCTINVILFWCWKRRECVTERADNVEDAQKDYKIPDDLRSFFPLTFYCFCVFRSGWGEGADEAAGPEMEREGRLIRHEENLLSSNSRIEQLCSLPLVLRWKCVNSFICFVNKCIFSLP